MICCANRRETLKSRVWAAEGLSHSALFFGMEPRGSRRPEFGTPICMLMTHPCPKSLTGSNLKLDLKAAMRTQRSTWAAMLVIVLGALLGVLFALRWMK